MSEVGTEVQLNTNSNAISSPERNNNELTWPLATDNPNYHYLQRLEAVITDFKKEKPEDAKTLLEANNLKVYVVGSVADPNKNIVARKDMDLVASGINPDLLDDRAIALSNFADFINTSNQELPDKTSNVFHMMQCKLEPDLQNIDITSQVISLLGTKLKDK